MKALRRVRIDSLEPPKDSWEIASAVVITARWAVRCVAVLLASSLIIGVLDRSGGTEFDFIFAAGVVLSGIGFALAVTGWVISKALSIVVLHRQI